MNKTDLYDIALNEFEEDRDEALWVRSQIESGHDPETARLRYIELRVEELTLDSESQDSEDTKFGDELFTENRTQGVLDTDNSFDEGFKHSVSEDGWINISRSEAEKLPYYGVGGWAILLVLGLFISPFLILGEFYAEPVNKDDLRQLNLFQWYAVEQIMSWALAAVNWVLLFGLFARKEWFASLYIWVVILSVSWAAIDLLVVYDALTSITNQIGLDDLISPSDIADWFKAIIGGLIWSLYVLKSKRINVTTRLRMRKKWMQDLSGL